METITELSSQYEGYDRVGRLSHRRLLSLRHEGFSSLCLSPWTGGHLMPRVEFE